MLWYRIMKPSVFTLVTYKQQLVIGRLLVRIPSSACRSVLGQDIEPQTAPDVLVGTLHGSHHHQCMMYVCLTLLLEVAQDKKCLLNKINQSWVCVFPTTHSIWLHIIILKLMTHRQDWLILHGLDLRCTSKGHTHTLQILTEKQLDSQQLSW